MSEAKVIKTITIEGKSYNYIEETTYNGLKIPKTAFVTFPIPDNYEDAFTSTGGYTRDVLYNKYKDSEEDIDTLTIIATTKKKGGLRIYFIFEKEGKIVDLAISIEELFLGLAIDFIVKQESVLGKVTIENSLNYINDSKYWEFMTDYDEPHNASQSGLKLGDEPILYGEELTISGLIEGVDMLEGGFVELVKREKLDKLNVKLWESDGVFGLVSDNVLIKDNGELFTVFDKTRFDYTKDKAMSDEEIYSEELKEVHKYIQNDIDRKIKRVKESKTLSDERKEERYKEIKADPKYKRQLDSEIEDMDADFKKPYSAMLTKNALNDLINHPSTTIEKVKS